MFFCNSTGTSHTNPSRCPWIKKARKLETAKIRTNRCMSQNSVAQSMSQHSTSLSLDMLSNSLFLHFHLHFLQQVHHLTRFNWGWNWGRVRSKFPAFRIGLAPLARARGTSMSRHNTAMPTSESLQTELHTAYT